MPKKTTSKRISRVLNLEMEAEEEEFLDTANGYDVHPEYDQFKMSKFVYESPVQMRSPGWCDSAQEFPRRRFEGKTRFHRVRNVPKRCECKNVKCQCSGNPGLEAIEDEKPKENNQVVVKSRPTNASVLRDASILLKEDQKQQRRILELLSASRTYLDYEKYLEELRQIQETEALLELEKKHLCGQLSYEEAILAKKRVVEENAKKREDYLEEKTAMEEELQAFREREMSKVKEMVKDVQQQHEKTKTKQRQAVKTRQKAAKAMSKDLKEMIKNRMKEREIEVEKKIAAIKEFKILQQIKKEELNSKEEKIVKLIGVSIEELKARLALYKKNLREEVMKKKTKIMKQKCRTEMIVAAASNFIQEVKHCREEMRNFEKSKGSSSVLGDQRGGSARHERKVEDEQIIMLRAKLEEARMRRHLFQGKQINTCDSAM